MSIRRSSAVMVMAGIALVALAAIIRFWFVPSVSKLPASLDITNTYTGTATLLNAEAVQAGDMRNAILQDVPVTLERHTFVSSTHGDTAIVQDDLTMNAPNGVSLRSNHTYAVNRKTMLEASAPDGTSVESHTGITVGLPVDPDPDTDYSLYDPSTRAAYPLELQGNSTVAGRDVLRYTASAQGTLADAATLNALPPALPKAQLTQIAALLPPDNQAKLSAALPTLPDDVPVNYTATTNYEISIDSTLGIPSNGSLEQQVVANVSAGGQDIPLMPVLALDATLDEKSVASAADSNASTATKLDFVSIWVPLGALVIGLIAIAFGFIRRAPASRNDNARADNKHAPVESQN
ncbi:porin PorA family protein [Nocardia xishanensis]|uniref:Porin PorA family protein n=1 Tax=Nocardia xishanensis TaxID=238964 RepID=A0ABW7XBR5_9NOCA